MGDPHLQLFRAPELGNTSFLLADEEAGDAVVVDPFRDVEQYLAAAESVGARITLSLETHVHNDFVSGSRELRKETGAETVAADGCGLQGEFVSVGHGDSVSVGRFTVSALHTPGHTPWHVSYLVSDGRRPLALFSGGALMVGGIARPDLFGPQWAVPLAHEAFRTLHERLSGLPDDLAVYPTHGAGSFCGSGGGGAALTTTLGDERLTNPMFQLRELLPFIARALQLGPYPDYYSWMGDLNRRGAPLVGVRLPRLRRLRAPAVRELRAKNAQLLDLRQSRDYDAGHIRGSYSIPLDDSFSAWAGWLLDPERPIVLIGGGQSEQTAAQRQLFRIGYDLVPGALAGGLEAWEQLEGLSAFETMDVEGLAQRLLGQTLEQPLTVLDVRDDEEWSRGHIPGAVHIHVPDLQGRGSELPAGVPVAVHCQSGYRASIAASLLEQQGVAPLIRVTGGYPDWERLSLPAVRV